MKRITFILGLFLLLSISFNKVMADVDIDRKAVGGSKLWWWSAEETYNAVSRKVAGNKVTIRCDEPGSAICPQALVGNSKPYPDSYGNDMVTHAIDQINLNNLSGTLYANFVYGGIMYLRSVSWTGTNAGNNEIYVIIVEN